MRTTESRLLVPAIVASQLGPPFMFSGVAVALPRMGVELSAGATSLGLVETVFLAASLAFLLPAGRLADAGDKRALYLAGLVLFVASSVAIGALSSMPFILGMRFVQGAASAITAATGPAILAEVVPPERRGRAYGSSIGAIYAGLTLGPIAAGALVEAWGWRAVFFGGAAVIAAGAIVVGALLPMRWRRPRGLSAYAPSGALVLSSVIALVAGTALVRRGAIGYACTGAGLALAAAFVARERRLARPLLDVRALAQNPALRTALSVQLLLYVSAFCSVFLLSLYLQSVLHEAPQVAGRTIAVGSVLMAIVAPFSGALADRVRPELLATAGVAAILGSSLLATTLDASSSLAFVTGVLALQGLGFALFSSPNMTIIMGSVSPAEVGIASALGAKSRALGMLTGMLLTATLVSLAMGDAPIAESPGRLVPVMRTTFGALATATAIALLVSVLTRLRAPRG